MIKNMIEILLFKLFPSLAILFFINIAHYCHHFEHLIFN